MPILKQSPVSHSKKRPRLDRAMISAPLGDFRHTMHIGRGGDAFGDTSFLSNHGGSKANGLPPEVAVSPGTPSNPGDVSGRLELLSSSGSGNGVLQSPATSTPDGSFVVLQHPETEDRQPQKPPNGEDWDLQKFSLESPTLEHAESLLSFQLDLGPSILEDVLGVMDKDWDSVRKEEQEPLRAESSSPVEQLHQDAPREEEEEDEEEDEGEEEEEEDEGQGYSFEDEQDEEIGL
ncbi:cdc42 effector protein 5 [Sceloporus undulatus]|uniref:cdc42 effector protein 5 n=1 Tax=Sceloporus undulatus TaxID=8520 RepID=UPI001C4BBE37|nr:cdc42 effector protein 5 [Sceloporus undulatus]XP_042331525.1 cdc42 effector protein 5 [Sceloporus undulatus]XP_042331526.1 cdc42 effector protein 5 [Sceloporus undulatus]XP_042331527.1 cdc42 effector protein 5 [Sceloporus undulatus]XP_042331528.1 cdc42 effector protein 5 [Sceloporus undulatus]